MNRPSHYADRVVQASLKAVLEPIFEADFKPCSYGFRPNRRAQDAIAEIHHYGTSGYRWVLECDIKACFDEIDHTALMDRLRARIGCTFLTGVKFALIPPRGSTYWECLDFPGGSGRHCG